MRILFRILTFSVLVVLEVWRFRSKWMRPAIRISILFLAVYALYSFGFRGGSAEKAVLSEFTDMGFDISLFPPAREDNGIVFEDVALDKDRISSIRKITAVYDPLTYFFTGKLKRLEIEGLTLTGDLGPRFFLGNIQDVTFSGWQPQPGLISLPAQEISIKDARLSILTKSMGGLSFFVDATISPHGELIASVKSAQRFLSFVAKARGTLRDADMTAQWDIEQGKIELPALGFKATRLSGSASLSQNLLTPLTLGGQLRAGGLTIAGLPWQNATSTISLTPKKLELVGQAKSREDDGLVLRLKVQSGGDTPLALAGTLETPEPGALRDYVGSLENPPVKPRDLKVLDWLGPYNIDFSFGGTLLTDAPRANIALYKSPSMPILRGTIAVEESNHYYGEISLKDTPLKDIMPVFASAAPPAGINGSASLKGEFSGAPGEEIALDLAVRVQDASLQGLANVSGLWQWKPESGRFESEGDIDCKPAGRCHAVMTLGPQGLSMRKATLSDSAGGTLVWERSKQDAQATLTLRDFNPRKFAPARQAQGLQIAAKLDGSLNLTERDDVWRVKGGKIQAESGAIRVSPEKAQAYLAPNRDVAVPLARALAQDYAFTHIEIKPTSSQDGRHVTLDVLARGDVKKLSGNLPKVLNFKLRVPAEDLLPGASQQ